MVVVQADVYNQQVRHVIVAEETKKLAAASDPAYLFLDVATPEGKATGLLSDSVVSCLLVASMNADRVEPVIGRLSAALLLKLNGCLKAALELA